MYRMIRGEYGLIPRRRTGTFTVNNAVNDAPYP